MALGMMGGAGGSWDEDEKKKAKKAETPEGKAEQKALKSVNSTKVSPDDIEAAKTAHEVAKTAGQTKQINIEVAKSTNEAINQMVNAKVKTAKEAMGRDLTMEEVDNIFKQCKEDVNAAHTSKKTIVTGNLDLSSGKGGMNISHNGAGVNFQGSASVDSGLDVAKKMQQAHDQSGFGQEKK